MIAFRPTTTHALFFAASLFTAAAGADDWPQWLGPLRDGVWRETGIIEKFPAEGPHIRWRAEIGSGYSGPAVGEGRVYLTDRLLSQGAANPADPFARGKIAGTERVLCFNEGDGKLLWKHEYDCAYSMSYPAGPRATPVIDGGNVYALGAEGDLNCFENATGRVLWSKNFKKDFGIETPTWGFAGHPLLDGEKLICLVGGEGSVVVAFNKHDGKELWRSLSASEPGYGPPMIYEAAGTRQLIIWHPEAVNGLNPETGEVYWSVSFKVKMGLTAPTPRLSGDLLLVTSFYDGAMMLRLQGTKPTATVLWQGPKPSEREKNGLSSIISTPWFEGEHIFGVSSHGQLRCMKAGNGENLWETFAATTTDNKATRWANAFLIKQGDRFFLANEKGDLIIARLTPQGYDEVSRAHLIKPTNSAAGRDVVWSHPAFANRSVYLRNDQELVCASLGAK